MFREAIAQRGLASPWENDIQDATGGDPQLVWLVKAIISVESGWNPNAVRPEPTIGDSSLGLMQVLLGTARLFDPTIDQTRLLDPPTNISIGTAYLRQQVQRYGLESGISAYNAGRPISGNRTYVSDVLTYYTWFINHSPGEALSPDAGPGEALPPDAMPGGVAIMVGLGLLFVIMGRR